MKKKLEAELMSIAHRILKLKNRAELDQLQQETLKLYEKISVLRFVEDNFGNVQPTIGRASAEGKLEEIYGVAETPETKEEEAPAGDAEKQPVAEEKAVQKETAQPVENTVPPAVVVVDADVKVHEEEEQPVTEVPDMPEVGGVPEMEGQDKENGAGEGVDALEIPSAEATNTPAEALKKEVTFEGFENYVEPEFVKKEPDAPKTAPAQESWHNWEPAKETPKQEEAPKAEPVVDDWRNWEPKKDEARQPAEPAKQPEPVRDWRDWEPAPSEPKKEEPKKEEPTLVADAAPKSLNTVLGSAISLGLNDRIAFEKHLFGGSADDLNRVVSQLNTLNSFKEAKNFINDLVKPDYNNWKDKEEYEERFIQIIENRFN